MEGLLTNRIPLLKRLKWRTLATIKGVYGSISPRNKATIPDQYLTIKTLEKLPYLEVSYGFENIFKYFRVDMVNRLTYRTPGARLWGVLVSAQFNF
jgi:hypothetical protein